METCDLILGLLITLSVIYAGHDEVAKLFNNYFKTRAYWTAKLATTGGLIFCATQLIIRCSNNLPIAGWIYWVYIGFLALMSIRYLLHIFFFPYVKKKRETKGNS